MDDLTNRWERIQQQIRQACDRVGRDPKEIGVVAVTKYVDLEVTDRVLDLGFNHIGESRVKEAISKWGKLYPRGIWHFIGHLQRNKVKEVVGRFSYLHSLDRFSLAQELDTKLEQQNGTLPCFIQVNVSGEKSKQGVSPPELEDFCLELTHLAHIEVIGLMTMAPNLDHPEETRPIFRQLKHLQEKLQQINHPRLKLPHLSMGMSQDFVIAIEEGATWIRLGSVLMGEGKRHR